MDTSVEAQISSLESLRNEIDSTQKQLKELKSLKKEQLSNISLAIENHLQSLTVKDGKEWLNLIYWTDAEFASPVKEAYKSVFDSRFQPIAKWMKVTCGECNTLEEAPCTSWNDYKQKLSGPPYAKYKCQNCELLHKKEDKSQNKEIMGFMSSNTDDEGWGWEEEQNRIDNIEYLQSLPYSKYLLSEHWLSIRKRTLKKSGYRCQLCNKQDSLDVHHRTYERLGHENYNDTIALCRECHGKHHNIPNPNDVQIA